MKRYATFFLIAVMSLGLVFLLVTRTRTPHDAPAPDPEIVEAADAGDGGKADGAVLTANDAATEAAAPKPPERPLRVTALGWELVAAGVALTAPDGGAMGQSMELAPEATLEAVEARLARGGTDPVGADIAVLPLPAFVLAYDRLRALDPRAFVVVGFSRGREELHATSGALLKSPPATDEVVIATDVVKQKPPEYDPNKKRDIFKNLKEVQAADPEMVQKVEKLEKYFWALVRALARKGLISKEEFLKEIKE